MNFPYPPYPPPPYLELLKCLRTRHFFGSSGGAIADLRRSRWRHRRPWLGRRRSASARMESEPCHSYNIAPIVVSKRVVFMACVQGAVAMGPLDPRCRRYSQLAHLLQPYIHMKLFNIIYTSTAPYFLSCVYDLRCESIKAASVVALGRVHECERRCAGRHQHLRWRICCGWSG